MATTATERGGDGREENPCVVALCKCCGRIQYANAGKLTPKDHAEMGRMVAAGLDVRTTTVGWARSADWFCEVKRQEREASKPTQVALAGRLL